MKHLLLIILSLFSFACRAAEKTAEPSAQQIKVGAERVEEYLPLLSCQRVAVLANHTAMVGERHLVDMLVAERVNLVGIFSP